VSTLSPKAKILIAVGAVLVAVLIPIFVWSIVKGKAEPPSQSSLPQPSESSTQQEIELTPVSEDAVNVLVCGLDDAAGLTDVIMVVSYDVKNGRVNILQIPRDTYVGDEYKTGKINQVYFTHRNEKEPIRGLIQVINQQMSLPIDHYVTITLAAFRDIVDSIGGVTLDVPQRIEFLPDKIIEKGKQHLTGEQAEWFVRYRAGYPTGDIGRVNAQKLMLDALMQAVRDKGRAGMLLLASQNYNKITTDLPLMDALSLANEGFQVEKEKIQVYTLEGTGKMYNGYAVYEADRDKLAELLNLHFRPYSEQVSSISIAQVPAYVSPYVPPVSSSQPVQPEQSEPEWEETPSRSSQTDNQFDAGESIGNFPID